MVQHEDLQVRRLGRELLLDPRVAAAPDLPVIEIRFRRVDRDDRDAVLPEHGVPRAEHLLEVDIPDVARVVVPRDDVHRVRTTSDVTSVSIHLLANDTGCVLRHTFDEQTGEARPFRSGYVNAECVETGGTS